MAHDLKNRPLKVDDRVTIPGIVTAIDGTRVTIKQFVPKDWGDAAAKGDPDSPLPPPFVVEARTVFRAGQADNNGLDDWILEDVENVIAALTRNEIESRKARFAQDEAEAKTAHNARVKVLDDEYAAAQTAHAARMAALQPPQPTGG